MKRKIHLFLCGIALMTIPFHSFSQHDALKALLEGKETYKDITETVEQYLSAMPAGEEKDRLEKHFSRWAYYKSMHLGPGEQFVNSSKMTLDAVSALSDAPLTTANGNWSFAGPNSSTINNPGADLNGLGRVDRIAFHPSDASIIYAGTPAGGLWKTTDGGNSWAALSNYIPSLGVSGIVVDWSDPNTIYVLTGDGDAYIANYFVNLAGYLSLSAGVLVSHDGGVTWGQTGALANVEFVGYKLVQDPGDASILIAATSAGLYRTTNGGETWVLENTGKHYDVVFKPGTPSTVYASGPGAFYYSTNSGDTWNNSSTYDYALCAGGRVEIGVTSNSPNRVFLLAGPVVGANTFCGFYQSLNSGGAFTRLATSPNVLGNDTGGGDDQSQYDMGVAVKPNNYQTIITAGLITYKSVNGGSVFTRLTSYRESGGNYIHPDVHYVTYNPLNNFLYAGSDGGFYRSTDDGATWVNLYSGINATQFYHLDDYDANQYAMLAGCQDNGVKYKTANTTGFSHILCCDGADVVIDYTNQAKGFAAVNSSIFQYTNFTSTSPGNAIITGGFFMQIEMHASSPNILYLSSNGVYSFNSSTGNLGAQLGTARGHWALKVCPSNANRLYAAGGTNAFATTGEMYMSINGGTSWDTISDHTGFPSVFPRISDIGVCPVNSAQVYACISGYTNGVKVYYSANAGTTWINISYDLPNIPVWSIEVDAGNNAYIGCEFGVYYKAAGATSWEPFYNSLPNVPVSDLAINESSDQLLAATFGRGIWKSQLHATCLTDLTIGSNVSGSYFNSASNSITMSSQVVGGVGASAVLRAGSSVNLMPGFQADSDPGNKFLACLGPCGSGMPPVFTPNGQGGGPGQPSYEMKLTRNTGTLEVATGTGSQELIVRQFREGPVRVVLTDAAGMFIREIVNTGGQPGETTYSLNTTDLKPGLYYLYLIINSTADHLQELDVK